MADWRDVMYARAEADSRVSSLEAFAGRIEDSNTVTEREFTLAFALTGAAICHELRALSTLIDHARADAR